MLQYFRELLLSVIEDAGQLPAYDRRVHSPAQQPERASVFDMVANSYSFRHGFKRVLMNPTAVRSLELFVDE
jgi:hypothetical protein